MATQETLLPQQELKPYEKPEESLELSAKLPAPMELLKWAKANGIAVTDLGAVMQYALEWQKEQARLAWIEDFDRFKAECPVILKNKHVGMKSQKSSGAPDYWYAELDKAAPVIIESLTRHNFTHRWETDETNPQWIKVTCVLTHKLGHSEKTTIGGPPDPSGGKNAIQAVGSSNSYLQRYSFFAACGIVPKGQDSDGVPGIPTGTRAERCEWIANCRNMEELMRVWKSAMEEASALRDYDAQKLYMECKDRKKDELIGGQL